MLDNTRHSHLVQFAKIALPLAALALLSTMFLVSDKVDPSTASIYATVDVAELAREERLGQPHYSGMTEDGGALTVRASAAFPSKDAAQGARAQDVVAELIGQDGVTTNLAAKAGQMDPAQGLISLTGDVAMRSSSGYRLTTSEALISTDRSRISMPQHVSGEGPFGTLDAGSAVMEREAATAPFNLVFNGGVKLIYQPEP